MKSILTILTLGFVMSTFGKKTEYPKGVYLSFEEIRSKYPSLMEELEISRRTNAEIKMNGGKDYELFKSDKSISKKIIKQEYYIYSNGDSLYINCIHYKIQSWYAPILSDI